MRTELLSTIKIANKNRNSLKSIPVMRSASIASYRYYNTSPFKNIFNSGDKIIFYKNAIDIVDVINFISVKLGNVYVPTKILVHSNEEWEYNAICLKLHDYYIRSKNNRRRLK